MTYPQLCADNRYLHQQLELCTMMMGHSLLNGQLSSYVKYRLVREDIKGKIEANLDLMEAVWETPVANSDKKVKPFTANLNNERDVLLAV